MNESNIFIDSMPVPDMAHCCQNHCCDNYDLSTWNGSVVEQPFCTKSFCCGKCAQSPQQVASEIRAYAQKASVTQVPQEADFLFSGDEIMPPVQEDAPEVLPNAAQEAAQKTAIVPQCTQPAADENDLPDAQEFPQL